MKCQVDKMPSWQNDKLTKWQVDKMPSSQKAKLTKCRVDKMPSSQNAMLTKWCGTMDSCLPLFFVSLTILIKMFSTHFFKIKNQSVLHSIGFQVDHILENWINQLIFLKFLFDLIDGDLLRSFEVKSWTWQWNLTKEQQVFLTILIL